MTTDREAPTPERIIDRGGWHRDYAVVLSIAVDEDVAVALVAGNGLGYEMEIELWRHREEWDPDYSFGLPPSGGGHASGGTDDCCFAAGVLTDPDSRQVLVAYRDEVVEVPVAPTGAWSWIAKSDNRYRWGDPEVVISHR